VFIGAALVALVLALVGWLLWRSWVPSAPGDVSAQAPSATSVMLTWTAPDEGPDVDGYLVLRNEVQVGSVPPATLAFSDAGLLPDTTYRYTVVGTAGSKRSAPSAELAVHTLPAQPTGLRVSDTTATEVSLTWSEPDRGPTPESWVVIRDGTEVATISGSDTSYTDIALAPGTRHVYRVLASSGTARSEPSDELVATTLPAMPTGLKASARTTSTVTLAWAFPAESAVESFAVLRGGDQVGTVTGTARAYVDKGLIPGTKYTYTVVAVSGGQRSAEPVGITVATVTPPVADGRLVGSYDVDGTVTKSTAGITLGSAAALGQDVWSTWTFTPKCTTGACDAVLAGRLAGHSFTMALVRKGAVYTGTAKAHVSHCEGLTGPIPVTNTLTLQLTVRTAGLRSSVWSANSWAAALKLTSPYTAAGTSGSMRYYCPAGSLTASLTGTR
jgi:hypothetical protein